MEDGAIVGLTDPELGIPHMANGLRVCANLIGRSATINLLLTTKNSIDCLEATRLGLVYGDAVANGTGKSSFEFN